MSDGSGTWLCTGALINQQTVITAASCVERLRPALINVVVSYNTFE
jgi:V8-like Glu-specific endopeptidase